MASSNSPNDISRLQMAAIGLDRACIRTHIQGWRLSAVCNLYCQNFSFCMLLEGLSAVHAGLRRVWHLAIHGAHAHNDFRQVRMVAAVLIR